MLEASRKGTIHRHLLIRPQSFEGFRVREHHLPAFAHKEHLRFVRTACSNFLEEEWNQSLVVLTTKTIKIHRVQKHAQVMVLCVVPKVFFQHDLQKKGHLSQRHLKPPNFPLKNTYIIEISHIIEISISISNVFQYQCNIGISHPLAPPHQKKQSIHFHPKSLNSFHNNAALSFTAAGVVWLKAFMAFNNRGSKFCSRATASKLEQSQCNCWK